MEKINGKKNIRPSVVDTSIKLMAYLSSLVCNNDDKTAYISLLSYEPFYQKTGLTKISVNGAGYKLPITFTDDEIEAIYSELIAVGAVKNDGGLIEYESGYDVKKSKSFLLTLDDFNLLFDIEENKIKTRK